VTPVAWLAFLAAAAIGACGRFLLDGWLQRRTTGSFPWGTLLVNVSGCLVLGVVTGLGLYHGLATTSRTVVGTGGLGAYTTFSTFTFESVRLVEEGAVRGAFLNVAASMVFGLAAAAAGLALMAAV
jgi:CrcB protein